MKLLDLIVENKEKLSTGLPSVDDMLDKISPTTVPNTLDNLGLPVHIASSSWETLYDPERLYRTFQFTSVSKTRYFVTELLAYQERNNHQAQITINGNIVSIETYTHDVNTVTEQDLKLSRFCDEIYEDTRFFISER